MNENIVDDDQIIIIKNIKNELMDANIWLKTQNKNHSIIPV